MRVTNSAFLLATVATAIDSAHSMHNACRPCASCSIITGKDHRNVSGIKINAHGILFGCLLIANRNVKHYGTKSECKIAILIKLRYSSCLPSLDLVQRESAIFWLTSLETPATNQHKVHL